ELKLLYAQYLELKSFAQFGSDLDADTKARLALGARIVEVLKQKKNAPIRVGCQVAIVYAVIHGYLNEVEVSKVQEWENRMYEKMEAEHEALLNRLESGLFTDDDVKELEEALASVRR
ncbi:MAG: F0F1 ATP synthase subunit alpha, partial [Clostridiales bacterium]|nr:F0F1 ATP synthase subunit alpha [Clostridiales bacterium]